MSNEPAMEHYVEPAQDLNRETARMVAESYCDDPKFAEEQGVCRMLAEWRDKNDEDVVGQIWDADQYVYVAMVNKKTRLVKLFAVGDWDVR